MNLKSRFQGEDYRNSRPHYPAFVFSPIKKIISTTRGERSLQVLDLGAGTGFAAASFLRVLPTAQITLAEPDLSMLTAAQKFLPELNSIQATAEDIPLPAATVDLVLIGSAWHWMHYEKTHDEIARLLTIGGVVYVFEYQFPKAQPKFEHSLELNEWVRRQFNLHWKAPLQAPRGSLFEITEVLRSSITFTQCATLVEAVEQTHSAREFAAMIFSQSRFLHYEASIELKDRKKNRLKIEEEIRNLFFSSESVPFLYSYSGFAFRKRG